MQDKHLFEYAVMRVVPKVEREEFVNVGVILYCKSPAFLGCVYKLDSDRLKFFCAAIDVDGIEPNLQSFERICKGQAGGGPIAILDAASRFRWLTATRSTVVQTSKVHCGFCTRPEETLQRLCKQMVL
jgi:hypothetical protein